MFTCIPVGGGTPPGSIRCGLPDVFWKGAVAFVTSFSDRKKHANSGAVSGVILESFWGHFGTILGHFWGRYSDRFSRCVFYHFIVDFDVNFGSILVS